VLGEGVGGERELCCRKGRSNLSKVKNATDLQKDSLERKGRVIPYSVVGHGPPLFVIGFGYYTYRLLSEKIKGAFQCIVTDYCGLNDDPAGFDIASISLDEILEDLRNLQQKLGFPKINVLGHSSSGTVAIDYALTYPDSVEKAFLICSPDQYDERYMVLQRDNMQDNLIGERKAAYEESMADFRSRQEKGLISDFFTEFHDAQRPLYLYDYKMPIQDYWKGIKVNPLFIENFASRTYSSYQRRRSLQSMEIDLVVILGRFDFAAPAVTWERYSEYNNVKVHIMENSSHYPMIEEQELFDEIILNCTAT
jgi:proline iminopeptidase